MKSFLMASLALFITAQNARAVPITVFGVPTGWQSCSTSNCITSDGFNHGSLGNVVEWWSCSSPTSVSRMGTTYTCSSADNLIPLPSGYMDSVSAVYISSQQLLGLSDGTTTVNCYTGITSLQAYENVGIPPSQTTCSASYNAKNNTLKITDGKNTIIDSAIPAQ